MSRYLDGELAAARCGVLERHVSGCLSCRREMRSLSRTIRGLDSLHEPAPAGLADRVIAAMWAATSPQLTVVRRGDSRALKPVPWRAQLRTAARYCVQRSRLRFTVPVGLVLGAVLSVVNQGAMLLEGNLDAGMCAVCALDFLLPFVAMNIVLLMAARLVRGR
jgi:anti-sigma factor RsiW